MFLRNGDKYKWNIDWAGTECLGWSGQAPGEALPSQLGASMHLCPFLNEGHSLLHLEQSVCLSSAGSTCYHIFFKWNFSDSWKLGKSSNESLLFIMSASLRVCCYRACGRSPFLFFNLISNTSFSKQQLTLLSVWNWLAPGSFISKRVSYAVARTDAYCWECFIVVFLGERCTESLGWRGTSC